ncbi:methylaspartate mutase [Streptomyces sp. NPDC048479]|uniref:methylaspartate mutase n=1 Tax=Streptomyces sp. NPDC048479 TaxID=3154725 RepID=UPI00343F0BAF
MRSAPRGARDFTPAAPPFGAAVAAAKAAGELVVQPRMGFPTGPAMRRGLEAVRDVPSRTVGTITLDSYTRVGDHGSARRALDNGESLNGYPLVAHGPTAARWLTAGLGGRHFAVQVRHGSSLPLDIFRVLLDSGLDATEGGPVSYCLPYSRTPLSRSVDAWARCCELLADRSPTAHLESFGGCLLGQLCPPGLLVAMAVLEGMFFEQHGLRDISLSYAQQTDFGQDVAAIAALRRLGGERLTRSSWHIVLYTYMGVFPRTEAGALALLRHSASLAARTGVERLIVKTPAEAHRIPTVEDNVRALEEAARSAADTDTTPPGETADDGVYEEARTLVDAVLDLHPDVGTALVKAFARGCLDVPYCLHADNAQRSRSYIDGDGRLRWLSVGAMPIRAAAPPRSSRLRADDLIDMLSHVQSTFDCAALAWA